VKVVFLGTPEVAVPFLQAIHDGGHQVPLVITNPDRPAGRDRRPRPTPVKKLAQKLALPFYQPRSARRPSFLERIQDAAPDILVVVAYGRILPVAVLEAACHGAVNVHFSLLPKYRGAAPVQWALVHGESVTGVTTMKLDAGMDEGEILLQSKLPILPGEHAPALFRRLVEDGVPLLSETLSGLEAGSVTPRPQDHDLASYAPIISRRDGEPDPGVPASLLEGLVRGFDPWPGVWLSRNGTRVRIRKAHTAAGGNHRSTPGTVLALEEDGLHLACGGGTVLALNVVQPEGKRQMTAEDAVNGRQLAIGDLLQGVDSRD
jgi:methionyl-tRNA formyltransferase